MTTHILYHANCYDGFGSAYVCWRKFGANAFYHPMYYNSPIPESINEGDHVYMVDYSRKPDEINGLLQDGIKVTVIDHHKSAIEDLQSYKSTEKPMYDFGADWLLDTTKSGALLCWEYFFSDDAPMLIQHISDRDLWKFEIPGTKEIHAGLRTLPFNFEGWDSLVYTSSAMDELKTRGHVILEYDAMEIGKITKEARMINIASVASLQNDPHEVYHVPIVNTSILFSEVPHTLLLEYPDAPFAMYEYRRSNCVQYGLRSRNKDFGEHKWLDFDVSKVAKAYGGGGHMHAAGFERKRHEW